MLPKSSGFVVCGVQNDKRTAQITIHLFFFFINFQYRRAVLPPAMKHQRSFSAFGFGAEGSTIGSVSSMMSKQSRRGSQINVNVTPSQTTEGLGDTPEIRKYKKRFGSDILCAALWGKSVL